MAETRDERGRRVPAWLVFTVLRVIAFVVPLLILLALGADIVLATVVAGIVGLCISVIFLSRQRRAYAGELAALGRRKPRGESDEDVEDQAVETTAEDQAVEVPVEDQNASAAPRPKP